MKEAILITGASSGIGASIVEHLDRSIYQLVIGIDINPPEFPDKFDYFFEADISDFDQISAIFKTFEKEQIFVISLVNAAGIPGPNKPVLDSTIDEFDRILKVNLRGTMIVSMNALDIMVKYNQGRIVNISSVLASCGMQGSAFYSAAKAGIVAITKSLAIEFADKGIRINCVSPGGVNTPLLSDLKERVGLSTLKNMHPVKRISEPREIANLVKFLIESDTGFMTGSEIFIDGGYSAQ